jgi:hypothetical protein
MSTVDIYGYDQDAPSDILEMADWIDWATQVESLDLVDHSILDHMVMNLMIVRDQHPNPGRVPEDCEGVALCVPLWAYSYTVEWNVGGMTVASETVQVMIAEHQFTHGPVQTVGTVSHVLDGEERWLIPAVVLTDVSVELAWLAVVQVLAQMCAEQVATRRHVHTFGDVVPVVDWVMSGWIAEGFRPEGFI